MPAFSFEKISPPTRRGPIPPIVKKQRGVIVKILDRFVEARVKRTLREEKGVIAAYRARRLILLRHLQIEGWSSLLMRKVG